MRWPDRDVSRGDPDEFYCDRANSLDLVLLLGERILRRINTLEELDFESPSHVPTFVKAINDIGTNVADLAQRAFLFGETDLTRPYWAISQHDEGNQLRFTQTRNFKDGFTQTRILQDSLQGTVTLSRRGVSPLDQSIEIQRVVLPWRREIAAPQEGIFIPSLCHITAKTLVRDRGYDTTNRSVKSLYYPFGWAPTDFSREVVLPDDHQEHARSYISIMSDLCRHLVFSTRVR